MVVGAILKVAAKGAAKGAKKGVSRAGTKKEGDLSYNARRRYTRAAERYLKKAENTTGAAAARYRHLATEELKSAMGTYDKGTTQKISKPIQNLASKLGVDVEQQRRNLKARTDESAANLQKRLKDASESRLEGELMKSGAEQRRQDEARAILNNDQIGSRILGGTVNIWRDKARVFDPVKEEYTFDKSKILPALYEHFKVDNLADLLLQVEKMIGDILYTDADSEVMYETVKLTIQNKVKSDNTVVQ